MAPTHESPPQFHNFTLTLDNLNDVEVTPQGKVVLYIHQDKVIHKVIVKDIALNQFLSLVFGYVKNAKKQIKNNPEYLRAKLIERLKKKPLVISTIELSDAPSIHSAFRVTSPEYTPIPHRVLFDFVEGVLKQNGIEYEEKKVYRFFKRMAVAFRIASMPLSYARPDDALAVYLVVSNANNARDAIHVFTLAEILACKNGLIIKNVSKSIAIPHRGGVQDILMSVHEAVMTTIEKARRMYGIVAERISSLERIPVTRELVEMWLNMLITKTKLPKKYHGWFRQVLEQYIGEFGCNTEAMFQTMTYFVSRLNNKNRDVAKRLNDEAYSLIENPTEYVKAIAVARR